LTSCIAVLLVKVTVDGKHALSKKAYLRNSLYYACSELRNLFLIRKIGDALRAT